MDDNKNVKIFLIIIGVLVLGTIATVLLRGSGASGPAAAGQYDQFATCLKDKGAQFYGAFWCPHCQAQKKLFGSSVHLLPYIECSTADANGQTQVCIDKGIKSYPTWYFADGSVLNGEIPLQQLADKTSCALPGGTATPALPAGDTGTSSTATPASKNTPTTTPAPTATTPVKQ